MVACGEYETVASVCDKFVRVAEVTEPDPVLAEKYEKRYQQFRKIYPACKELFAGLAEQ
jgi:xylulokinase